MARRILPTDLGMTVLLVDSITEISGDDADCLVISGSHGGRSAARSAAAVRLAGCVFNAAGPGKDDAGIAELAAPGSPALACSHLSARIGDPQDAWDNGTVRAVHASAEAAGLRGGLTVER